MNGPVTSMLAALAACASNVSPAQWVLIGLIAFLLLMLVVAAFEDYWLAVEQAFQGHGVGRDDMKEVHERTWPEYWQ